jgi:hypothetical protein
VVKQTIHFFLLKTNKQIQTNLAFPEQKPFLVVMKKNCRIKSNDRYHWPNHLSEERPTWITQCENDYKPRHFYKVGDEVRFNSLSLTPSYSGSFWRLRDVTTPQVALVTWSEGNQLLKGPAEPSVLTPLLNTLQLTFKCQLYLFHAWPEVSQYSKNVNKWVGQRNL